MFVTLSVPGEVLDSAQMPRATFRITFPATELLLLVLRPAVPSVSSEKPAWHAGLVHACAAPPRPLLVETKLRVRYVLSASRTMTSSFRLKKFALLWT